MMRRLLLAGCLAVPVMTGAAPFPTLVTTTLIDGASANGAQGVVHVNQSAGTGNMQVNAASIAVDMDSTETSGPHRGAAASIRVSQHSDVQTNLPDHSASTIAGQAFNHASGLINVSQASGVANTQTNQVAITFDAAIGEEGEVSQDLAGNVSASGRSGHLKPHPGTRAAFIAPNAFLGTQGVVQVNQSAGSWNATTNSFGMRIHVQP